MWYIKFAIAPSLYFKMMHAFSSTPVNNLINKYVKQWQIFKIYMQLGELALFAEK